MSIQIVGLSPDGQAIMLSASQLSGSRSLLLSQPENVRLLIRAAKRARGGASSREVTVPWKVYGGKVFPEGEANTPTLFGDTVYNTFQHALLAFLFWIGGGMTQALSVHAYPRGRTQFPHFAVSDASTLGMSSSSVGALAVHLLGSEPSHGQIRHFASTLLSCVDYGDAILLVGSLRPSRRATSPGTESPQLRGVLLRRARMPNPLPEVVPCDAVEFGWYLCSTSEDDAGAARIRLAYQGVSEDSQRALAPAVVPPLPSVGHRVWRKGQTTYALAPKAQTSPHPEWDQRVLRFLQADDVPSED